VDRSAKVSRLVSFIHQSSSFIHQSEHQSGDGAVIGKIHLQQCNHSLARLLIVAFLLVGMSGGMSGCNLLSALPDGQDVKPVDPLPQPQPEPFPKPDPLPKPEPEPPKPVEPTEADYWNALADLVEAGRFTNTDQIVLTAKSQKSLGHLKDLSRLSEYEAKRSDVTDSNKNFIANKIRGG
jgi:hypothetical protein